MISKSLLLLAVTLFGLAATTAAAPTASAATTHSLSIDTSKTTASKFGISTFIENGINFATDGGIYAELIRDRAFQEDFSPHWVSTGGAKANQTTKNPLSKSLPNSVIVTPGNSSKTSGLLNKGYYGIPVRPQTYTVSFYARSANGANAQVTAKAGLYDTANQKEWASVEVPLTLTGQWQQFKANLVSTQTAPNSNNSFGLTLPSGTSAVQLNLISLFPPTYEGTVGRPDLAQALADLQAPYTRLPGGNELEGGSIATAYNWSQAVGPLTDRPGRPSVWAGYDTDGYGLHESLDLFEKIGSEPIIGLYAGYSLDKKSVSKADLQPYVQSAIDQLHYIKDPQGSSAYAKRREANGRAQPWTLNIVEIGNEDWIAQEAKDTYGYRYNSFYKQLKAAFPSVKFIASSPYSTDKSKLEGIDQHDYNTPKFAYSQFRTHDSWPRNGTEIMELEYAVINNGRCGEQSAGADLYNNKCRLQYPTLEAALSEGVWTMGFERNGDVVTAAAYAPLLHNAGNSQWNPDLIAFDHDTVALSPSYWTQYAFSRNRIDTILGANLTSGNPGPIYWSAGTLQGSGGKTMVVKLINSDSSAQNVAVTLSGGRKLGSATSADVWGFGGLSDLDAVNTVADPQKVKPYTKTMAVKAGATDFTVSMPPHSFQVVKVALA